MRAFVGLGSNLDDPAAQVAAALRALARLPESRLLSQSRRYRNPPMGPADQPDYVNAVAEVETGLDPHALLDALLAVETAQGRHRTGERWGPRVLDLDLLLYGDRCIEDARLTVPHPGMHERNFVLYPLQEIAPDLQIPGLGSLAALCARCPRDGLLPLD